MPNSLLAHARGASSSSSDAQIIWWRNPWVWLVLAGPLAVIVAGLITVWIAARGADTLVDEDYYRKGLEINKTLAPEGASMTPAVRARNHAADPSGAQKAR